MPEFVVLSVGAFMTIIHDHTCVADRRIRSRSKIKRSTCQQDDNSLGSQIKGYAGSDLPEVWLRVLMIFTVAGRITLLAP